MPFKATPLLLLPLPLPFFSYPWRKWALQTFKTVEQMWKIERSQQCGPVPSYSPAKQKSQDSKVSGRCRQVIQCAGILQQFPPESKLQSCANILYLYIAYRYKHLYIYICIYVHIISYILYIYTRHNVYVICYTATHIIWLYASICYVIFQNKGVQGAREPRSGNLNLHEPQ